MRLAILAFAAALAATTPAAAFLGNSSGNQPGSDPFGNDGQSSAEIQISPVPRELVAFESRFAPGTIVVSTSERRLYYVLPSGQAIR